MSHTFSSTRPSHLQPSAPPSSFSRSAAVRNSLRKIPSSLFAKDSASLKGQSGKPGVGEEKASGSINVSHPRPLFGSPRREKEAKDKSKGKTRKALAEILHWGNAITQSPPKLRPEKLARPLPPIHAQHTVPTPPAKDIGSIKINPQPARSPPTMPLHAPAVLRKRSSRYLPAQPSRSGLSALSALASSLRGKSSTQDVKPRARPSMAPDPFERNGQGAEVVDVPPARLGSVSSASTGLDRRGSIASRKALSTKTVDSEKASCKTLSEKSTVVSPVGASLPMETLVEPRTTVQLRHTSVPLPIRAPLTDLPTRNASLGRVLGDAAVKQSKQDAPPSSFRGYAQPGHRTEDVSQLQREAEIKARPVPSPASAIVGLPAVEDKHEAKGLRKEKTKSKVWSLFRGKKDRSSDVPTMSSCQSSMAPEPINDLPRRKESLRKPVPAIDPSDLLPVRGSSLEPRPERSNRSARRHPPVLHLTKPSVDGNLHAEQSGSTFSVPFSDLIPKPAGTITSTFTTTSDAASGSPGKSATVSGDGGVWESVAGSLAERHSVDGPRQVITTARCKPVPKRKSLTGLFGLAMKKSFDRIKPDAPPSAFTLGGKEGKATSAALRSLAEEMEVADPGVGRTRHSSPPFSARERRRDSALLQADADLSQVASATDKLLDLVERFDFSPAPSLGLSPSPASTFEHPSFTSIDDGSPTPMRRIRSAVLTSKKSKDSPLRPGTNISPLKLALHRSQMAQNQGSKGKKTRPVSSPAASPPRISMVRKGTRNIFAPPSPPKPLPARPTVLQPKRSNLGSPTKLGVVDKVEPNATDAKAWADRRFSGTNQLGLPLPPPEKRISPRRFAQGPPALSLPPIPDALVGAKMSTGPLHRGFDLSAPVDPRASTASDPLSPDIATANRNSFDFTGEFASLDQGDKRYSFVEALAKVKSSEAIRLPTLSPVPPLLSRLESLPEDRSFRVEPKQYSQQDSGSDDEDGDDADEACRVLSQLAYLVQSHSPHSSRESKSSKSSTSTARRSPRPPPFQGNPAFRMRVSQLKESMTPPTSLAAEGPQPSTLDHRPSLTALSAMVDGLHCRVDSLEPPSGLSTTEHSHNASLEPPRPAYMSHAHGAHGRAESGISIATMSSLGAVIETGIAGEYTNYFEVNFTKHLQAQEGATHSRAASSSSIPVPSRRVTRDSITRPPKRHDRRNSSIASIESLPGVEVPELPNGPPVSMYNPRRSHISYVSRHRRAASGEGSFGRPDWAAHRRNSSSVDSTRSYVSTTSISRLGRPGLGAKMFELDGGVQLTAIAASPATLDDEDEGEIEIQPPASSSRHRRDWSMDSLDTSRVTWDSILDSSFRAVQPGAPMPNFGQLKNDDDLFGDLPPLPSAQARVELKPKDVQKGFFLQPLRPVSMISSVHSTGEEDGSDDTCINVAKYAKHLSGPVQQVQAAPAKEQCFEGEGEDETMTEAQLSFSTNSAGSFRRPGTAFDRPTKPRRKPATLVFKDAHQPDTPVLSSPSTSEASSRLSLETKFSDGASLFSASRLRPLGAGHARQKSSQGVTLHPTIKEEPSLATLRANCSPAAISQAKVGAVAARAPVKVKSWYADGEEDDDQEVLEQMRKWSELRHEAEHECRRGKELWQDPRSSSYEAVLEFRPPKTVRDIMDFLAKSQATYRPLEEVQAARRPAHRHKSSLKELRSMISPYGLPLPKPPSQIPQRPKGSLQTKFERTNSSTSATSSKFSFGPEEGGTFGLGQTPRSSTSPFAALFPELAGQETSPPRPSTIFAQFAREVPPSPPPSLPVHHFSPFHLSPFKPSASPTKPKPNAESHGGAQDVPESRVTSSARRKALGWGRRRNSDGPVATLASGAAQQISALPGRSRVEVLRAERSNVPSRLPLVVYKVVNAVSPTKARARQESVGIKRSGERSTALPDLENMYNGSRVPTKASSRKTAKRAQSQPLAMRI